jgi:phytoene synthase
MASGPDPAVLDAVGRMNPELSAAYRACRSVARRAGSNFAWVEWLLPAPQRRGMQALYAFARRCDDLADARQPLSLRREALARWRQALAAALAGHPTDPILYALADTVTRFVVPTHLLWRIVDGVEMDLNHTGFATYGELRRYCEHVASAVGLACLAIWGCRDEEAILPAADCGVAFQLTNILRDLKEDAQHGRVYLPRDELARFGTAPIDFLGLSAPPGLKALVQFECQRAAGLFEAGRRTEAFLDPAPRRVFHLMWSTYRALLARIERDPAVVLRQRVRLPRVVKAWLLVRALGAPATHSTSARMDHPYRAS